MVMVIVMVNIILHLDMNSYFASVIQQDKPEYRGRPLGVCEHLGGIIIGASIEAKKWGITTGTPVWEARKLYPKIILTHTTAERFRFFTRKLIKLVSDYTDDVEVYSIDEVFLDITRVCNVKKFSIFNFQFSKIDPFIEAVAIAKEIKRRMKTEVGDWLTCSIGIAENKVLAKVASDLKKPDGLVVIVTGEDRKSILFERSREQLGQNLGSPQGRTLNFAVYDKTELYHRLKLTDIPGIGHRQEKNLNQLGIKTLLDLKNYPKSHLIARFGRVAGHHLYYLGQLESTWKADVNQDQDIKSIGHMYTLPKEYREKKFFIPVLYKLCEMVGRRLRRKDLEGNVIHFFFYDDNYRGMGKSQKLGDYIFDSREIFIQAVSVFEKSGPCELV